MAKQLTEGERAAIVAALEAGESVNGVAKKSGRSAMTVSNLGKAAGVDIVRTFSEKAELAASAQRDYNLAGRLELLNLYFQKAASLLASTTDPSDFQRLAISVGILIDKRRLEDGDVTSRTESVGDNERDGLASRLDELATRRRTRQLATGPQSGTAASS